MPDPASYSLWLGYAGDARDLRGVLPPESRSSILH